VNTSEMPDEVLLTYLKEYKPYLFDIECAVNRIATSTGYGEANITLRVAASRVDKITTNHMEEKLYLLDKKTKL